MNVYLDPQSERLVEQQLRDGRYGSPEEVVARALEALAEGEPAGAGKSDQSRAVEEMLEFARGHQFTIGEDHPIRDLLHESHRYRWKPS